MSEIVRALRICDEVQRRKRPCESDCYFFNRSDMCSATMSVVTADRLESQQRENADLNATLTAERDAEKARADAAVNIAVRNVFYDMIGNCKSLMCYTSPCSYCQHEKSREKCAACFENGNFELRDDLRGEKGRATE